MPAPPVTQQRVQEVDAPTLSRWLSAGDAILIDVREADEHTRESIPGSLLLSLSAFDGSALRSTSGAVVLHCHSGSRSAQAAERLVSAEERSDRAVYTLRGGIRAWKAAGLPTRGTDGSSAPKMPVMRQVLLVAGSAVLVGSALAAFVSPWFLVIPVFFGAGLAFAGATGACGMASLLMAMPWNRAAAPAGTGACRTQAKE